MALDLEKKPAVCLWKVVLEGYSEVVEGKLYEIWQEDISTNVDEYGS